MSFQFPPNTRCFSPKISEPHVATSQSEQTPLQLFEGGATRSPIALRFDLIPREAIDALSRRLAYGAQIHGEHNWRSGGEGFRQATINHLVKHLMDYLENGNADEANTDAIICNAAFLCYFEAMSPRRAASSRSS